MSPQSQLPPKPRIVLLGLPFKFDLCSKGEAKSLPNLAQQAFPLDRHLFLLSPNPLSQKTKCRQKPGGNHTSLEHLLPSAGQNLPGPWLRLLPRAMSGHVVTEAKKRYCGKRGWDGEGWDISRLENEVGDSCPGTSFLLDTRRKDRT